MLSGATHPAARPADAAPAGVLPDIVQAIANLFETTCPAAAVQATHLWWLAAAVIAGAIVRFWGLDGVGLHGDEETMAMAASHILVDGRPLLPSGMFYPRALTQLYAMALSMSIFGETEWALRLPSALCGVALIGLAFVVGRRFLRPHWSVALATTVAFLPALIVDSQTARMYVFVVTCVMGCLACLFEWERTDRAGWLIAATLVLIVGIDMHLLAVAAVPIFLLPGLVRGDVRKFLYGAAAALVVAGAFVLIEAWSNAQYPVPPPEFAADLGPPQRSRAVQEFALTFDVAIWAVGLVSAFFALHVARAIPIRRAAVASAVLLLAGIGLQLVLFYHLAALAYLAGVVLARRYGSAQVAPRIVIFVVACALLGLIHVTLLASAQGSIIKLVGSLVGQPSVWPYVRIAQLSQAAGVLTCALLAWGLYQLAYNRRVSDYWLLAVLGVWGPVFAVGLFTWDAPTRYTAMSLAPMLLCAFAFAQRGTDWLLANVAPLRRLPQPQALAAALTAVCVTNPLSAAAVINAGYGSYPDHKGAAEFMRSQQVTDDDLVLAEDVLQQTWYLGKVDYWLIGKQVARRYVKRAPGGVVDFYTGTPVIATRAMLDELLQDNPGKRVFIVGSGEGQRDQRRGVRGKELHEAIESDRFETIYVGRDGLTRVLRAVPGRVTPSAETSQKSDADAKSLATAAPPTPVSPE